MAKKPTTNEWKEFKLGEFDLVHLQGLNNIKNNQVEALRQMMAQYLSWLAIRDWGYEEGTILNFDIDLDEGDGTVKVKLAE